MDDHSSGRAVARTLWLPTRIFGGEAPPAMAARSLFGIAPGGACRAGSVARPAVGSYPTVSPLPGASRWRTLRYSGRFDFCGAVRRIAPPGGYPAPLLQGVRTFLERYIARGHPALRTGSLITALAWVRQSPT